MSEQKENQLTQHGQWRSTFAFIMATTGAAVGLGNIWKFPHMAGDHGGSAFVLVYLACVLIVGVPTMIAEVLIGRLGRKNPVDTLRELALRYQRTPIWGLLGWMGALSLLCVLSFYSVVAGWAVAYFVMACQGLFNHASPEDIKGLWDNLIQSPSRLLLWHSVFMVMTLVVVARGVEKGIETASKILMPMLFVILILLVIFGLSTGDAPKAFNFLFSFKFSALNSTVMIAALGHAFFTLALGAGALLVYGAYMPASTSLSKSLIIVALLDILVALLAGLAIFPIVFQYNLPPSEGFGLMYIILPVSFATLPFGQWVGAAFFLLLIFAAWTSTFSLAEPMVMLAIEKLHISRNKASLIVGFLAWFLGIGALLSFNITSGVLWFGRWDFFTLLTIIPTNVLLPLGGLGFSVFAGWVITKDASRRALGIQSELLFKLWCILVRYIAPIGIATILISGL